MALDSMQDLLVDSLRDLLNAEKQLVAALPKMAKGAQTPELQDAFRKHLEETRTHVSRAEQALESLGVAARGKHCPAMEGLIEEGNETLQEEGDEAVLDAAIISAAQKVEHYEIASYGSAITYAEMLGERDVATLLKQTLAEEEAADQLLTRLAEADVNRRALEADPDAEEEDEEESGARTASRGRTSAPARARRKTSKRS